MNNINNPPLKTLYFYLSSSCNLKCRHCWISPIYANSQQISEEMSLKLLEDIIDQALLLGIQNIKITGGEPFLNRNIFGFIDYVASKRIKINIETNGTLIDFKIAKFLKKENILNVAVSLDGPKDEVHEKMRGVELVFNKTINGIKLLVKEGICVQIIMSLYRENICFVEDTVALAQELGARSFKINIISRVGRGSKIISENLNLSVNECIELNKAIEQDLKHRYKIPIFLDIPPAFKSLQQLKRQDVCHIFNILGVLSDGKLALCGIGENVPDLVFGDIRKNSLKEIWESYPVLLDIRNNLPDKLEGICGKCLLRQYCIGRCRAEAYYIYGNIFAPYYFCKKAYQEGLFPSEKIFEKRDVCKTTPQREVYKYD